MFDRESGDLCSVFPEKSAKMVYVKDWLKRENSKLWNYLAIYSLTLLGLWTIFTLLGVLVIPAFIYFFIKSASK